ncbi:hypothetical protein K8R00_09445 [Escherichia coli]|nr:hypothetical protein [Escherichia coli]MDF6258733.1 hypothetical protein [Escherichia coli]MDF6344981.1 hypothetical protein [Escherichia coli]MDF6658039.1 hypothetical protein [Escherichia coli]
MNREEMHCDVVNI